MLEASLLREISEYNECISKNKKPLPYPVKKSLDRWFKQIQKKLILFKSEYHDLLMIVY
jgi:hypothetical protein